MRFKVWLVAAIAAVTLAFAVPASATAPTANIGDGGGGACTSAINGYYFQFSATMWSYAWMTNQGYWSFGYWYGTKWACLNGYWYRFDNI